MLTQIFLHWFCLPVLWTPPKRRDCLLSIQRKLVSRYHLCQHPFSLSSYFFLNKKKYSMLASIVVRCSHQSDRRIRVFISYQSYHSVWISCTNYSIWVFFFSLANDVMKSGAVGWPKSEILGSCDRCYGLWPSPIKIRIYRDMKGLHSTFYHF